MRCHHRSGTDRSAGACGGRHHNRADLVLNSHRGGGCATGRRARHHQRPDDLRLIDPVGRGLAHLPGWLVIAMLSKHLSRTPERHVSIRPFRTRPSCWPSFPHIAVRQPCELGRGVLHHARAGRYRRGAGHERRRETRSRCCRGFMPGSRISCSSSSARLPNRVRRCSIRRSPSSTRWATHSIWRTIRS